MRLLFSCVGRRIELLRAFSDAAKTVGIDLEIHGADGSELAPALSFCDHTHLVPPIESDEYVPALLDIVRRDRIDMLVPLIDTELVKLSRERARFDEHHCNLIISEPRTVEICRDKLACYQHFTRHHIDTPATWTAEELARADRHEFPYFLKPRFGSAGLGNYRIADLDELKFFSRRVQKPIVQEFVDGVEHTLDAYTGLDGVLRCVVPRRRIEVRGGEVSKSLVVMSPELIDVGERVVASLEGWRGVITIQCIQEPNGRVRVIEVNPRFGGGVPLAIRAGADFPRWLLIESTGTKPDVDPATFHDQLYMLRFDQSVFVNHSEPAPKDTEKG